MKRYRKLHTLLGEAIKDLKLQMAQGVKIDMSNWILSYKDECFACLGGCFLLQNYPEQRIFVDHLNFNKSRMDKYLSKYMQCLNLLRMGNIRGAAYQFYECERSYISFSNNRWDVNDSVENNIKRLKALQKELKVLGI